MINLMIVDVSDMLPSSLTVSKHAIAFGMSQGSQRRGEDAAGEGRLFGEHQQGPKIYLPFRIIVQWSLHC